MHFPNKLTGGLFIPIILHSLLQSEIYDRLKLCSSLLNGDQIREQNLFLKWSCLIVVIFQGLLELSKFPTAHIARGLHVEEVALPFLLEALIIKSLWFSSSLFTGEISVGVLLGDCSLEVVHGHSFVGVGVDVEVVGSAFEELLLVGH